MARAAFGIETFKVKSRAVVPLYGRNAPKTGKLTVIPLRAGDLALE